jgi:uncharacterized protein YkwD
MKKNPNRDKQRLILLAVTVLLVTLLFLSISALSPPALADQNSAVENNPTGSKLVEDTKNEDPAASQKALLLPSDKAGTGDPASTEEKTTVSMARSPVTTGAAPTSQNPQPAPSQAPSQAPAASPAPTIAAAPSTVALTKPKTFETTAITPTEVPTKTPAKTETTTSLPQTSASIDCSSADNFIILLNNYRLANGLAPLQKSSQLTGIAEKRSIEISIEFSHAGMSKYGNYGENIFMCSGVAKSDVAAKALQAFKNSPAHDMNQLSDRYKTIGVGHYIVSGNTHYLTVSFGY